MNGDGAEQACVLTGSRFFKHSWRTLVLFVPLFWTYGKVSLACFVTCVFGFLRLTSDMTPAEIIVASMAADPIQDMQLGWFKSSVTIALDHLAIGTGNRFLAVIWKFEYFTKSMSNNTHFI